jgi:preprotein translocase subunit YajC
MNEVIKKQIRKHFIWILVGVLIILILGNEVSWLRYFNVLAILILFRSIIWFVANSEELLFYLFPIKLIREPKSNQKGKIWSHISMVLFFTGIVFLIIQMNTIENIIEELKFWKVFGILGFGFSVTCLFVLYKIQPSVFTESGRRYSVIFGFVLGITSLTVSTSGFLNKAKADEETIQLEYIVNRKSVGGKRNGIHWVFTEIKGAERRFKIKSELWNGLKVGDKVLLKTQKGYFGYDFVTEIKPKVSNVY